MALQGIDPDVLGVTTRARAFEQTLAANDPGIRIVEKRTGSFNVLRERQVAEELLESNPDIDACVALSRRPVLRDGFYPFIAINKNHWL